MQFHDFNLVQMVQKGPKINIPHWRARAVPRASVGVPENFFIAFLDELDNFKSFEPYFFWRFFGPKIANLAIWRRHLRIEPVIISV